MSGEIMGEKEIEKEMYDMGCKFLLERYNNQEGALGLLELKLVNII